MSYDVCLIDQGTGKPAKVPHFEEGGTLVIGGSDEAHLNITFNYAEVYGLLGWNVKNLGARKAVKTIDELNRLVAFFGTRKYANDYWAPTPGNAGHALNILLEWAKLHPEAIWEVCS